MTRLIEVSHWGNIAVEETIDIRHTGALLKGPFSRYEYQRNQDGYASVKSFTVISHLVVAFSVVAKIHSLEPCLLGILYNYGKASGFTNF